MHLSFGTLIALVLSTSGASGIICGLVSGLVVHLIKEAKSSADRTIHSQILLQLLHLLIGIGVSRLPGLEAEAVKKAGLLGPQVKQVLDQILAGIQANNPTATTDAIVLGAKAVASPTVSGPSVSGPSV